MDAERPQGTVSGRWVVTAILILIGIAVAAAAWVLFGPNSKFQQNRK